MATKTDIRVENHGTIVMLRPLTDAGKQWLDDNLHAESWQFMGDAIAVEPRMVEPIIDGATGDGMVVR